MTKFSRSDVAQRVNKLTRNPEHLHWFEAQAIAGLKLMQDHYDEVRRWQAGCEDAARAVLASGRLSGEAAAGAHNGNVLVGGLVPSAVWSAYCRNTGDAGAQEALARSLAAAMSSPDLDRRRLSGESDDAFEARRHKQDELIASGSHHLVDGMPVRCSTGARPEPLLFAKGTRLNSVPDEIRVAIAATRLLLLHDAEIEEPRLPGAGDPLAKVHARHLIQAVPDSLLGSDYNVVQRALKDLQPARTLNTQDSATRIAPSAEPVSFAELRSSMSKIWEYASLVEGVGGGGGGGGGDGGAPEPSGAAPTPGSEAEPPPAPLVRVVLRGRAAWVALCNSACALRDDAFTLIRSTAPDSPERINGTPSGHSPRSSGHVSAGLRGTDDMGRDHAQWVTWKVGLVGLIEKESMQSAVARQIDALISAGAALIDSSMTARNTTDARWARCFNDLNDAINELTQLLVYIPVDTDPIKPTVLNGLITRLIAENRRVNRPHADGGIDAHGYPDSMEAELLERTWGKEMEECSTRHAFWLDRTTVDAKSHRTSRSQRVMAVLFELGIAMGMLKKGPAADELVAAYQAVLHEPYWVVEATEEWGARTGKAADITIRYPLVTTTRPIAPKVIQRLEAAIGRYANSVVDQSVSGSGHAANGHAAHGDAAGLSANQQAIWDSLDRKCKTRAMLVAEGCGLSETQIGNDIRIIRLKKGQDAVGRKPDFGYYRPDAPPDWMQIPRPKRKRRRRTT